jgi:hypothetical protein
LRCPHHHPARRKTRHSRRVRSFAARLDHTMDGSGHGGKGSRRSARSEEDRKIGSQIVRTSS